MLDPSLLWISYNEHNVWRFWSFLKAKRFLFFLSEESCPWQLFSSARSWLKSSWWAIQFSSLLIIAPSPRWLFLTWTLIWFVAPCSWAFKPFPLDHPSSPVSCGQTWNHHYSLRCFLDPQPTSAFNDAQPTSTCHRARENTVSGPEQLGYPAARTPGKLKRHHEAFLVTSARGDILYFFILLYLVFM